MAGRDMLCPVCHGPVRVPRLGRAVDLEPAAAGTGFGRRHRLKAEQRPRPGRFGQRRGSAGAAVPPPLPGGRAAIDQRHGACSRAERPPWGGAACRTAHAPPALAHLADDRCWLTRLVLGVAALDGLCSVDLTVRHWAAIWAVAVVFAAVSAAYGAITAFAFAAGADRPLPWGMEPIRHRAAVWSATVLAVHLLATYACGSIAGRRRAEAYTEWNV